MIRPDDQTLLKTNFNAGYLEDTNDRSTGTMEGNSQEERVNGQFTQVIIAQANEVTTREELPVLNGRIEEGFEIVDREMSEENEEEAKPSNFSWVVDWLVSGFKRESTNEVIERARERCLLLELEQRCQNQSIENLEKKLKELDNTVKTLKQTNQHLEEENGILKENQKKFQNQIDVLTQENNRLKEAVERK